MRLNAADGDKRKFILVQIPALIDVNEQNDAHFFVTKTLGKSEATIFEITAERLRRAGAKIAADKPDVDVGFRVFELADDPDALFLQTPLQKATQADFAALQMVIATPQPAQLPRVLHNLLLAEHLPLTTVIHPVKDGVLYRVEGVLLVVRALPLAELADTLTALRAQKTPVTHLTVYAPWIADDNFMLGIKTLKESHGFSEDKLRLRG